MVKFLPFLLLLFASCQKNVDPVFFYDVEAEFNLSVRQALGNRNNIIVYISTTTEMPDNYKIQAFAKIVDRRVELNIYQIQKPSTESENKAILYTTVEIDSLGNGVHEMDLIIRETILNEGAFTISDDQIQLDFTDPKGIAQSHIEVNRFPPDAFWGVAYVDSSYHDELLDVFMDSLAVYAEDVLTPMAGNYGYFSIGADESIALKVSNSTYKRSFYMTASNFSKIDEIVQAFKAYEAGFHAHIMTAKGQIFYNVGTDNFWLYKVSDIQ